MKAQHLILAAMWLGSAAAGLRSACADDRREAPPWLTEFLRAAPDRHEVRSGGVTAEYYSLRLRDSSSMHYSLRLVFVRMRPGSIRLHVQDVRRQGGVAEIVEQFSDSTNDILVVNGGFFGTNDGKRMTPMGLVVSGGKVANAAWNWSTGGVLAEMGDGQIAITPIRSFRLSQSVREGLQSRPLLVKESLSAIGSDNHELANRTAVAVCVDGSVLVAGAFSDDGRALSLYEFAAVLTNVQAVAGATVADAINLDGGPGSHIYIPRLSLHLGGNALTYIPNMLRFSSTR